MENNKKEINSLFNNEEKNLKTSFENYKNFISNIKPTKIINDKNKSNKNSNENSKIKAKYDFNMPSLKLLNYKKAIIHVKTIKDEDNENRINLKVLLPYSASEKNILPKVKDLDANGPVLNKNNKDLFISYSTSSIVAKKALNEFNYFKRYKDKNDKINNKISIGKMPNLKEYEKLAKTNSYKLKLERKKLKEKLYNSQKYKGLDLIDLMNSKIQDKFNYISNFEKEFNNFNTISH